MTKKIWRVKPPDPLLQYILSRNLGISGIMAQLLVNRGIYTVATARDFLEASLDKLHSPFLMRDMEKAVELAARVIERKGKILVFGDYDADGITGTALLVDVLKRLGGNVEYHVPHRIDEGYGLNSPTLATAAKNGVELVITVDCGISNVVEIDEAKKMGGPEVIVTDHHEPPSSLPAAAAVINPKRRDCHYPFRELAGVGVAFKFAQALVEKCAASVDPLEYLDLVCLGTVADIVPLHGENRVFVKYGLKNLSRTSRPGLTALINVAGAKTGFMGTREVGYVLAPRINAAGRIGDAATAVELLLCRDYHRALELAAALGKSNHDRQELETIALGEALGIIDSDPTLAESRVLVLESPNWHPGVIGIVASRLVERFSKPVLLIAGNGIMGKGSGRSVKGFNLVAALKHCSDCLVEYGGHSMAAGFSIELSRVEWFREKINEFAAVTIDKGELLSSLELDALVSPEDVTCDLVEEIMRLEPHGEGNPRPLLGFSKAKILQTRGVGKNEAHLKLRFGRYGSSLDGIGFNLGRYAEELAAGKDVGVAFTPAVNNWQGRRYLQALVKELQCDMILDNPGHCRSACEGYLRKGGDLIFVPETMLALVKQHLVENKHQLPGEMQALQSCKPVLRNGTRALVCPPPNGEGAESSLNRLQPPETKCILLLTACASQTIQLARHAEYHNPSFAGCTAYINGFMTGDQIYSALHNVYDGTIKLLISTYSCLPEDTPGYNLFHRVLLARPPAVPEDWLAVTRLCGSGKGLNVEVIYSRRDLKQNMDFIKESLPDRDMLAGLYLALRSIAGGNTGMCPTSEAAARLESAGIKISSILPLVIAVSVFAELDLLHYRWEEGMLKYKLLPAGGQRRDLNASSTFVRTREIEKEWLKWVEAGYR